MFLPCKEYPLPIHQTEQTATAHVTKSLVLVQMVLIALSILQEWLEKAGLTLEEGSEAALGLHWRYFDSDAPSCCCTWKPRGAGSICLCAN